MILTFNTRDQTLFLCTGRYMTTDGGEPSELDLNSVEHQVITFLQSKGIVIGRETIVLLSPEENRKHKMELLKQGKKLKGTQVYLNEHLTKKNGEMPGRLDS